ncbi:serine/threonine-protein kinase RsbW [Gemmobacter aquatilis]|uniref:Serine/threonine-protein kinase RsbW n=2 Tax=Gemmobacter aquatilis TaxID=933059 RepID=A0A1H8JRB5_9RHOB|nr:serine/threonine-protein kinase RsbW [Gemmobacter aquatilis]
MWAEGWATAMAARDGPDIRLDLRSDPFAVRDALGLLRTEPGFRALGPEAGGQVEIVLAEVLNNVVEHAYAGDGGWISVHLCRDAGAVGIEVRDHGRPMPGLCLPDGTLPELGGEIPEGGFGWFLIRSLTRDLKYSRDGTSNRLSFNIPLDQ